jgi:hypothetical protein
MATRATANTAAHDVDGRRPSASAQYLIPLFFDSDGK